MKKFLTINIFCILLIISTLINGCSNNNNSKPNNFADFSENEISSLNSLLPERNDLLVIVKSELKITNNSPLKLAPGNYYFSLSNPKIETVDNLATADYSFIYIDNFNAPTESHYEGSIIISYERKINAGFYKWHKINTQIIQNDILKSNITGIVKNKITSLPIENVIVYGFNDNELTRTVKTHNDGTFIIKNVLENNYKISAIYKGFEEYSSDYLYVPAGETTIAPDIELYPNFNINHIDIKGYVYYDLNNIYPVKNAFVSVFFEDTSFSVGETLTDENGFFNIPNLIESNYTLHVSKGSLIHDDIIFEINNQQIIDKETIIMDNIYLLSEDFPFEYTLTYLTDGKGIITGISPQLALHGQNGSAVYAEPYPGYMFYKWSDNSLTNPRTDNYVIENITVTAEFQIDYNQEFELTVTSNGNGILSENYNGFYNAEDPILIKAIPDNGYRFSEWSGNGALFLNENENEKISSEITMIMPNQNIILEANFEPDFSGGTGTINDPYIIADAENLHNIRYFLNNHFILTSDIDLEHNILSEMDWYDSTQGWIPIGNENTRFTGTLNGNFKSIKNMFIQRPAEQYIGLFGFINEIDNPIPYNIVSNIKFENANVRGLDFVGILTGRFVGLSSNHTLRGLLYNIHTDSNSFIKGRYHVGGIFGSLVRAKILNNSNKSTVDGYLDVGGIAGQANNSHLINSYNTGTIMGDARRGGLTGRTYIIKFENCFSNGLIVDFIDNGFRGAFVGYNEGINTLINSYFDIETSNAIDSLATSKTTSEMTFDYNNEDIPNNSEAAYYLWDFVNTWNHDINLSINNGYPYLQSEF